LIEHRPDMRSIVNILVGQVGGDNLARVGIDADVKFAPDAPLCRSMLFEQPFSGAAQFQACAVDDQMERVREARGVCKTFNPRALRLSVVRSGTGRSISSNCMIEPIKPSV
jgi:hypothetical protein